MWRVVIVTFLTFACLLQTNILRADSVEYGDFTLSLVSAELHEPKSARKSYMLMTFRVTNTHDVDSLFMSEGDHYCGDGNDGRTRGPSNAVTISSRCAPDSAPRRFNSCGFPVDSGVSSTPLGQ